MFVSGSVVVFIVILVAVISTRRQKRDQEPK